MAGKFRHLTVSEKDVLVAAGCRCADWERVSVADGFLAARVWRTSFEGDVRLGRNDGAATDRDGIVREAGICDACIADAVVGDDALICRSSVLGYEVGDGAVIENTGKLACTLGASFGRGVAVRAVNEGGGREVMLTESLGAQSAYLAAMYRHRPGLAAAIATLSAAATGRGCIGKNVKISGCCVIRNVNIGDRAAIEGAADLCDGTVGAGAYIGSGVCARGFMCAPGARLSDGASVERCWVGEACILEKGFTAVDSLFFANSHMACGEAVSVFAGPYSVSHHKSSLLIAGYFLFFNAGSGSNQSNHLFRAGPVHQGIHERGCKFGSNAYVMLPAREGAFTTVIGRHTAHHDTADMPYSILIEEDGRTFVHPGAAIRSFGFGRDAAKWPARDRRGEGAVDLVNFEMYNPYTGMRLLRAVDICRGLLEKGDADVVVWNRVRIRRTMLSRGLGLYEAMLTATIGNILAEGGDPGAVACRRWVDMAGMFAPKDEVERLCDRIEAGEFRDMDELNAAFRGLHAGYRDYAYAWALDALGIALGHAPSPAEVAAAVEAGREAHEKLKAMRAEDARKDEGGAMNTGYGIDSPDDGEVSEDFRNVRYKI